MSTQLSDLPGNGRFDRGLHPPEAKSLSAAAAIEVLPTPASLAVPLLQHTGAPCSPAVKNKEEVTLGQVIGTSEAFISAPVHATVNGTAGKVTVATLPNGRHVQVVPITPEGEQLQGQALLDEILGGDWPAEAVGQHTGEQIVQAVKAAGIVGLGGAAFPTYVKLTPNDAKPVDTLLVNGCECEPYLTADHRLMVEFPAAVVLGARLAAKAAGAQRTVIAVEDNKPEAAEALRRAAEGTDVQVAVVHTRYPMGGERQVIPAVLKREVPTRGLPLDVGVVVVNVGTCAAVSRAVVRGGALTHRVVTVTGAGIARPKNLLVPIGASYADLIEFCGGLTDAAARVVAGGPMMGFALGDLDVPVTKGTSGLLALTNEDVRRAEETACVRCGRCADVCPLNLVPSKIALACRHKDWDQAKRYHLMACCECGCCGYICPASIPLVQLMRMGKAQMPKE